MLWVSGDFVVCAKTLTIIDQFWGGDEQRLFRHGASEAVFVANIIKAGCESRRCLYYSERLEHFQEYRADSKTEEKMKYDCLGEH